MECNSEFMVDIFKMGSWNLMGRTGNIIIKDNINVPVTQVPN